MRIAVLQSIVIATTLGSSGCASQLPLCADTSSKTADADRNFGAAAQADEARSFGAGTSADEGRSFGAAAGADEQRSFGAGVGADQGRQFGAGTAAPPAAAAAPVECRKA